MWAKDATASNNGQRIRGIRTGRVGGPRRRRALRAVLAGPAGRAVAEVVALRRVARRAVAARRVRAVVAVVLRHRTIVLDTHLLALQFHM